MSINKRKSYRFAVPSSRQIGELRFGETRLPAQVLDQSATGFAAVSLLPPGVEIGGTGLLRTGDDWYEIRLVYVRPIEPAESEETSASDDHMRYFRLGLYRLGDTVDPDKKGAGWSWPMLKDHLGNVMPLHSATVGFGMLFVTVVFILPVVTILLMRNWKGNTVGDGIGLTKSIAAMAKFSKKEPDWGKLSSGSQSEATTILNYDKTAESLKGLANYAEELARIIPQKMGASVFLMPQVVRQLSITEEQQLQLQQIVDATSQLITDLEGQLNGAINPDQYQKLLNMARDNALQSLTDEQRSKWQIISREEPQDKSLPPVKDDK